MRTRKQKRSQLRMALINLEDYVGEDDILRRLDKEIDLSFVNEEVKRFYKDSGRGAPPEDPERVFRLLVAMIVEGIRSERQLINNAVSNLRIRWYVGYDIDEKIIEHSTISKFRKRLGEEGFDDILSLIIQQCIEKGYIDNKDISIDRTDMEANAKALKGREQAMIITREVVKALETSEKVEELIKKEKGIKLTHDAKEHLANIITEVASVKPRDKKWVLEQITRYIQGLETEENKEEVSEAAKKKMKIAKDWSIKEGDKQAIKESIKLNDKTQELDIDKKKVKKTLKKVKGEAAISGSDADARYGHTSVKRVFFGYNVNVVMDHKHDLITACRVSRGNENGQKEFGSTYKEHKDNCNGSPESIRADSEYGNYAIRKQLEKDEVTPYIYKSPRVNNRKLLDIDEFEIKPDEGEVICPAGYRMKQKECRNIVKLGRKVKVFLGVNCNVCKKKRACTGSKKARWLYINFDEYKMDKKIKEFTRSEEFRKEMKKRWRLEASFGHGKTYHNLGKARYRGIQNVSIQAKLIATVLNMERMSRISAMKKEKYERKIQYLPKDQIAYSLN